MVHSHTYVFEHTIKFYLKNKKHSVLQVYFLDEINIYTQYKMHTSMSIQGEIIRTTSMLLVT